MLYQVHGHPHLCKLKIPGPADIIIVEARAQLALDCEQDNIKLASTVVAATKLKELCLNAQPSSAIPTMPSMFVEDAKGV
jgi:hypothetical protein